MNVAGSHSTVKFARRSLQVVKPAVIVLKFDYFLDLRSGPLSIVFRTGRAAALNFSDEGSGNSCKPLHLALADPGQGQFFDSPFFADSVNRREQIQRIE